MFLLDKLGITKTRLADESDVVLTTITKYCESDTLPGSKTLEVLVRKYRVRVEWLLGMDSVIFSDDKKNELREEAAANYEQECLRLKNEMADLALAKARQAEEMAVQQNKIVHAVGNAARHLGLDDHHVHALQAAVFNYEEWLLPQPNPRRDIGHSDIPGGGILQRGTQKE